MHIDVLSTQESAASMWCSVTSSLSEIGSLAVPSS